MANPRRKVPQALIIPALLVVLLIPPVLYVWGYFALSTRIIDFGYDGAVVRCYDATWKSQIYYPAGKVEAFFIRQRVRVEFDPSVTSGS